MRHHAVASRTAAGGGGGFDPENDINWHSLFWAEGSAFTALGLADGASVSTWSNETGETSLTNTGTNRPTYAASVPSLNNQPAISFAIASSQWIRTASAFAVSPSYASSGISIVVIARASTLPSSGDRYLIDGRDANRNTMIVDTTNGWQIYAGNGGSFFGSVSANTNAHLFVLRFDGSTGADRLDIDGTNQIATDAGSHTISGITFGARYTGNVTFDGQIALGGIYEGNFTADANYADFCTWAETHYGLTIA